MWLHNIMAACTVPAYNKEHLTAAINITEMTLCSSIPFPTSSNRLHCYLIHMRKNRVYGTHFMLKMKRMLPKLDWIYNTIIQEKPKQAKSNGSSNKCMVWRYLADTSHNKKADKYSKTERSDVIQMLRNGEKYSLPAQRCWIQVVANQTQYAELLSSATDLNFSTHALNIHRF